LSRVSRDPNVGERRPLRTDSVVRRDSIPKDHFDAEVYGHKKVNPHSRSAAPLNIYVDKNANNMSGTLPRMGEL